MQQLVLDIRPDSAQSFDNFICGDNAELLAHLIALADPEATNNLYLWGSPASGRSHLLRATADLALRQGRLVYFIAGPRADDDLPLPPGGLLIVDDIDALSPEAQIALFRACNSARELGFSILLSGPTPPLGLSLREDLRTRVGQMLVYQARALSDEDKARTFLSQAERRGMRIDRDIIDYLLRHSDRALPALLSMLDALDRASLEQKRPVTLPLVRELLADRETAELV